MYPLAIAVCLMFLLAYVDGVARKYREMRERNGR